MNYLTVPLNNSFNRAVFSCGQISLDNYIKEQANQDIKRKLAVVFVWPVEKDRIQGYYTLSSDNIPRDQVPQGILNKMPKSYSYLPTTLLGRLAVDLLYQGKGHGKLLLIDAFRRAYESSVSTIGSMAVIVDPLDVSAVQFYAKYGFIALPDRGRMFIPMATIRQLFLV